MNDRKSSNMLAAAFGAGPSSSPNNSAGDFLTFRPEVRGLYFNGKTVDLDGFRFIGCRFDNCVLRLRTTYFDIINCVLDTSTRVEYSGELAKVLQLFIGRYDWVTPEYFPVNFLPIKNPDGSITIVDRGQ